MRTLANHLVRPSEAWQSRGSWVRVPSPPLEIAGQGYFVPRPSTDESVHPRAIHARISLDIDWLRQGRNRPAARVPYPVGCATLCRSRAGGVHSVRRPADRRGRDGRRCGGRWPSRGRATPPPIRALPAGPSGSLPYVAGCTATRCRADPTSRWRAAMPSGASSNAGPVSRSALRRSAHPGPRPRSPPCDPAAREGPTPAPAPGGSDGSWCQLR